MRATHSLAQKQTARRHPKSSPTQWKERLVGQGEGQGYICLELRRLIMLAVGLVAPVADGLGGRGDQERVSAQGAYVGHRTVIGDLDFEDDIPGAMRGEGCGRILGLSAPEEAGFGLLGIKPDVLSWSELGG
jgi:hypothetical protein